MKAKFTKILCGLSLLSGCLRVTACEAGALEFYVSPQGMDSWTGTLDRPFKSPERARDAVREWKTQFGVPPDTVTVWIRGGVYETRSAFFLDSRDAGVPGAPVVYRSYPGESVVFSGGREIPPGAFKKVIEPAILERIVPEIRDEIREADLFRAGIHELGELKMQGLGSGQSWRPQAMELFYNGKLMRLARWPNEGYVRYGKVTEPGSAPRYRGATVAPGGRPIDPNDPRWQKLLNDTWDRSGRFLYIGDRPERWLSAEEPWLFGYWNYRWASETIRIDTIDVINKEITLAAPHHYGLRDSGEIYAFNMLEEIDEPGEYYINRETGKLYFLPPSPVEKGEAVVSVLDRPFIVLDGTAHIIIRDITFEICRASAIIMAGGSDNCIAGCTVRNVGGNGIVIGDTSYEADPGTHNGVAACELSSIRRTGIVIHGGDRKKLAPGKNYAVNNHLHDGADISVSGCGNRVAHNLFHGNTHSAIHYSGNDQLIEFNEIHHCLTDADDMGVIYTGRNPSCQGNIVRYNFIHHNEGPQGHGTGLNGIYLDDGTTGQLVFGNVIYKTGRPGRGGMGGTFVHGGKENIFANNIFIECEIALGFSYLWGEERWREFLKTGYITQCLYEDVNIAGPPHSTKYPRLGRLIENPDRNFAWNNVMYKCARVTSREGNYLRDNYVTETDPGFADTDAMDFTLRDDSVVFREIPEFKAIPFRAIGLYIDEYRKQLPSEDHKARQ